MHIRQCVPYQLLFLGHAALKCGFDWFDYFATIYHSKRYLVLDEDTKRAEIKNNAKFLLQDVLRNSENDRLFYARRKWVSISISLE